MRVIRRHPLWVIVSVHSPRIFLVRTSSRITPRGDEHGDVPAVMMVVVAPRALLSTRRGVALIRCSTHELRTVIPASMSSLGVLGPVGLNGQYLLATMRRTSGGA
jgi:hypothetical protein